jgi:uncharacterized protein
MFADGRERDAGPRMGMLTRRQALKAIVGAGCGAAGLGLYTWQVEPHWLEFTYRDLPIAGLPSELEGKTLAQISDIHVGHQVSDDYLLESFRRVAEQSPDFVAHTGDWITYHRGPASLEKLPRLLAESPRGRIGTVGILGNHDYGHGWGMKQVANRVTQIAKDAGVTMLRNESTEIAGLQFIGLDDLWGPYADPGTIVEDKGSEGPTIVLGHNPDGADKPFWGKYKGWMLVGHTHGGQCKPPFLPPPISSVDDKRYIAGQYDLSGGRRMYISRGIGHLLQVRFNARPEIPIFRLRRV